MLDGVHVPDEIAALPLVDRRQIAQDLRIRARDLHRGEEYRRAVPVWEMALQYDPDSAVTANGLATTLIELRRWNGALLWAQRAVDVDPGQPRFRETLGDVLLQTGDLEGAIAQYGKGLEDFPDDVRLQRRLSSARLRLP